MVKTVGNVCFLNCLIIVLFLFGRPSVGVHVILTEDTIVNRQVKLVPDTEPVLTDLTGKAVQVVVVVPGSHHQFKGRDWLVTGRTLSRAPKHPKRRESPFSVQE